MLASYIKALLHKNGIHWNNGGNVGDKDDMGNGATVTYNFFSSRPSGFSRDHYKNFSAFSATQKAQIRQALDHYEDVANIQFQELSSGGTLRFGYADTFFDFDGDGDFEPAGGLATRPHSSGASIVIDKDATNFSPGSWGYFVWLHELGHAVGGLNDVTMGRNPDDQYAASSEQRNKGMDGQILSEWQDSRQYTVMSYIGHPDMPGVRPRTLGLYDIAAIQTLYGANWSHNAGHNNYTWSHNETFIETIWDGGGNDTINASNQTRRSIIDLRAGRFSSIGSLNGSSNAVNNLAIAYGATIENAFGGTGNDRITGNNVRNILFGNAGNDFISGGGGDDFMDGGTGIDTVDYRHWDGGGVYNLQTEIASFSGYYSEEIRNFENIYTGDGADIVIGTNGANRIYTGKGNDFISALGGNDYVSAGAGADSIYGGAGNDFIIGGSGDDYMNGGSGVDTVDYRHWDGGGTYNLQTEVASFSGYYNEDIINFENIHTGDGADIVIGTNDANRIYTNDGNDFISALGGNDYVSAGAGADIVYGGAGNDFIIGGSGDDYMNGGSGVDTVDYRHWDGGGTYNLQTEVASFSGYYNEDIINFENIYTGDGADVVIGTNGVNRIYTGDGNDFISALGGNDYISAGADNDTVYAGAGDDIVYAGSGNDRVVGGSGDDFMDGGSGIDTVDYRHWNGGGTYNLTSEVASFAGFYDETIRNFENIYTGSGLDNIVGTSGNNEINAGAGDDIIDAGNGNDVIIGGSGSDMIVGGLGNDIINGTSYAYQGTGERDILTSSSYGDSDTFVLGESGRVFYNDHGEADHAVIQDFDVHDFFGDVADRIQLLGSAASYSLSNVSVSGVAGAGIHFAGDLIGIVQGVNSSSLNLASTNQFTYV
ncbi:MAG: M10 family metallopeptidase C-terminal domain-containing protein [Cyanobacteria bacterium P01_D01_bin.156]